MFMAVGILGTLTLTRTFPGCWKPWSYFIMTGDSPIVNMFMLIYLSYEDHFITEDFS